MSASRLNGFTLLELLTVIFVVGLLAAILVPVVGGIKNKAQTTESASNLRQIGIALHLYTIEHDGRYPPPRANPEAQNSYASIFNWVGRKPDRPIAAGLLTADQRVLNEYLGEFGPESEVEVAHAPGDISSSSHPDGKSLYHWTGSSYVFNFSSGRADLTPAGANSRTTESIRVLEVIEPSRFVVAMEPGAWVAQLGDPMEELMWNSNEAYYNLLFADGHVGGHIVESGEVTTSSYNFINE